MRVGVYILPRNPNAEKTCRALAKGISRCGDEIEFIPNMAYKRGYQAAVLWGFTTPCQQVIKECKDERIPWVFIDLGYWRRERGYFKVTVNDRHPTRYLMAKPQLHTRFTSLRLDVKPSRKSGDYILLAGMSGKASWSWNLPNESYEKLAIGELQKRTDRAIVYRPKPNWSEARPIPGSTFDKATPVSQALARSFCVVSHHSNVACDALLEGVPVFAKYGAASVLGPHVLADIETPSYHDEQTRAQWAANVAHCQWSLEEMASGACWKHFKDEGLLKCNR